MGDDVLRLANERPTTPWETLTTLAVPRSATDPVKLAAVIKRIRASDRVKPSVREKSTDELLVHYGLTNGPVLTNLGVLLLGTRTDRTRLGTAPVVQVIKVDERGTKISKLVWDDYALSPLEIVDAVWEAVPDFRESYALPDGLLRSHRHREEHGYWLRVAELTVLGVTTPNFALTVFPLGHNDIDGLVAMNLLRHFNFEVRPADRQILVELVKQR